MECENFHYVYCDVAEKAGHGFIWLKATNEQTCMYEDMEYSLQLHTVVSQPMGFLMPTAVISFHEM
jgi:hypothetical protein